MFIGLGSNLGDRAGHLKAALQALELVPGYRPVATSSCYLTAPVGPVAQGDFYNAVTCGVFEGSPFRLLGCLQGIEASHQRERKQRWGPRSLDLDILLFGGEVIDCPELKTPHPELSHRLFVLAPLAELARDLVPPGYRATVGEMTAALTEMEGGRQTIEKTPWD